MSVSSYDPDNEELSTKVNRPKWMTPNPDKPLGQIVLTIFQAASKTPRKYWDEKERGLQRKLMAFLTTILNGDDQAVLNLAWVKHCNAYWITPQMGQPGLVNLVKWILNQEKRTKWQSENRKDILAVHKSIALSTISDRIPHGKLED